MDYYINPTCFSAVFTLPSAVVDQHLKFAKAEHIKVLLYIMRNMSQEIAETEIADYCGVSEFDVKEALLYWADTGILLPKDKPMINEKKSEQKSVNRNDKPTRLDVAKRFDDPKVRFLIREAEIKFGRGLKSNEQSTLVWIYDDLGLDVSVIMLIIEYASSKKRANITFIESTAVDWVKRGIDNITLADAELKRMAIAEQAWGIVSSVFGLEKRKPSKKETELAYMWLDEWKLSPQMLERAYEECVNKKSKFSLSYTAKILENWHSKGYKTPDEIENKKSGEQNDFGVYDIDEFEKMLISKD